MNGRVYLIGAGPGDEGLITVKGKELLQRAEVLIYDRLIPQELLSGIPDDCEQFYVGKAAGKHSMKQDEINDLIVRKAMEGKTVVRLKGGDPFVFGRGGEEILSLQEHQIPYEVIPGVTSAIAALSCAGIPVTHREMARSFHVITGHTAAGDDAFLHEIRKVSGTDGTLIFLMGLGALHSIVNCLIGCGRNEETPAAVVSNGTMKNAVCVRGTLKNIEKECAKAEIQSPAIIAVGDTTALHFEKTIHLPLEGKTIALTGTEKAAEKLSRRLKELGAYVVRAGISHVVPEEEELLRAISLIPESDWIVFTSRNAVSLFFEEIRKKKMDLRHFGRVRFAAVGSGTADELACYGFYADLIPEVFDTECLAKTLADRVTEGETVLIPRSADGSRVLTEILEKEKIRYHDCPVYQIRPESATVSEIAACDHITFESASGVRGFMKEQTEEKKELLKKVIPVCIGNVTEACLREYGVSEILTADPYTVDGIVSLILREAENEGVRL